MNKFLIISLFLFTGCRDYTYNGIIFSLDSSNKNPRLGEYFSVFIYARTDEPRKIYLCENIYCNVGFDNFHIISENNCKNCNIIEYRVDLVPTFIKEIKCIITLNDKSEFVITFDEEGYIKSRTERIDFRAYFYTAVKGFLESDEYEPSNKITIEIMNQ